MGDRDVLVEFLELPLGSADAVFERFRSLPGATFRGAGLERFLFVPGTRAARVVIVAHADTVWDARYVGAREHRAELEERGGVIRNRAGGLGADDRAGCAMAWLLRGLGHSILITDGEERGCRGSRWLMDRNADLAEEINRGHRFAVQLDRRNGGDFKCYDVATEDFRAYVAGSTGYAEPDRSASSDIVALCRDICGVNLSVGYRDEHREDERLVVAEWEGTLRVCREWLSAEDLPRHGREGGRP